MLACGVDSDVDDETAAIRSHLPIRCWSCAHTIEFDICSRAMIERRLAFETGPVLFDVSLPNLPNKNVIKFKINKKKKLVNCLKNENIKFF